MHGHPPIHVSAYSMLASSTDGLTVASGPSLIALGPLLTSTDVEPLQT